MAKLNDAWVLKYSIFRAELQKCLPFGCTSLENQKERFLNEPLFEISYPQGKDGPRYASVEVYSMFGKQFTLSDLPENSMIKILDRKEKLRLYCYYKLDIFYYG